MIHKKAQKAAGTAGGFRLSKKSSLCAPRPLHSKGYGGDVIPFKAGCRPLEFPCLILKYLSLKKVFQKLRTAARAAAVSCIVLMIQDNRCENCIK